ncbi:GLIPR1-like protein 1 [Hemiscyllium ocellatum]|uniref:GLIPR1-like protein 1 n=1 Tax=Hemiscyllium ocellatum TaxID=170820 RepID=UPI002966E80E|nr:GLIPR1-like protein 1 [Hemiscyllium ocellatum]
MDAEFVKECTEEHNKYRSKVKPGASNMRRGWKVRRFQVYPQPRNRAVSGSLWFGESWDAGLAKTARAWSKTCSSKRNPHLKRKGEAHPIFETVGENIYVVSGDFTIKDAVKAWYDEEMYYNFDDNKCNKKNMCERYTQLVWGETYKLGCAANYCPKGIKNSKIENDGSVFVCNYSPSGNRKGQPPYSKGAPCTSCGSDFCRENLCSEPDREAISQYPEWNPDFGSASILLSNCLLTFMSISLTHILC